MSERTRLASGELRNGDGGLREACCRHLRWILAHALPISRHTATRVGEGGRCWGWEGKLSPCLEGTFNSGGVDTLHSLAGEGGSGGEDGNESPRGEDTFGSEDVDALHPAGERGRCGEDNGSPGEDALNSEAASWFFSSRGSCGDSPGPVETPICCACGGKCPRASCLLVSSSNAAICSSCCRINCPKKGKLGVVRVSCVSKREEKEACGGRAGGWVGGRQAGKVGRAGEKVSEGVCEGVRA